MLQRDDEHRNAGLQEADANAPQLVPNRDAGGFQKLGVERQGRKVRIRLPPAVRKIAQWLADGIHGL
jgi:hypothetical protein